MGVYCLYLFVFCSRFIIAPEEQHTNGKQYYTLVSPRFFAVKAALTA